MITILLKVTGELFSQAHVASGETPKNSWAREVVQQIKQLQATHVFGIVVGGGNFFRGSKQGEQLGLRPAVGHQVGMVATIMNGLILRDLCEQAGLHVTMLSSIPIPGIADMVSPQTIAHAHAQRHTIIFVGGTGLPFVTTDTAAIMRGLQINALEVWKGTNVDGVYDADPRIVPDARKLATVRFDDALVQRLAIMDATAYTLAREYNQRVRVFNIFSAQSLLCAACDEHFGTILW